MQMIASSVSRLPLPEVVDPHSKISKYEGAYSRIEIRVCGQLCSTFQRDGSSGLTKPDPRTQRDASCDATHTDASQIKSRIQGTSPTGTAHAKTERKRCQGQDKCEKVTGQALSHASRLKKGQGSSDVPPHGLHTRLCQVKRVANSSSLTGAKLNWARQVA